MILCNTLHMPDLRSRQGGKCMKGTYMHGRHMSTEWVREWVREWVGQRTGGCPLRS